MKSLITLCFTVMVLKSISQEVPMKDGRVVYESIDSLAASKDVLFGNGRLWLANAFKDSKEVIQVSDKESGEIVGKGNFAFGLAQANRCWFTVKINAKDNKYRIQFYDIVIHQGTSGPRKPLEFFVERPGGIGHKKIVNTVDDHINSLLKEGGAAMRKSSDNF